MSFETTLILGAILALLSICLIVAVSTVVVVGVRKARANHKVKTIKKLISDTKEGEYYNVDISRKIGLEIRDLEIVSVIVEENEYKSIAEALIYETVGQFRRKQLLKIESQLKDAYALSLANQQKVQEAKQEAAVEKQEARKEKFFTMIDTGKDMDGKVYIYKACEFIISNHLKAEIVVDKETGYMELATIWYAPEGNVKAPKALIPFDVRTARGNKAYTHYIESNNKFYAETENIKEIIKRLDKYNEIHEEGRISQDKHGMYIIEAPEPKEVEPKEEKKQEPKEETAKDQVNEQFEEPITVQDLL